MLALQPPITSSTAALCWSSSQPEELSPTHYSISRRHTGLPWTRLSCQAEPWRTVLSRQCWKFCNYASYIERRGGSPDCQSCTTLVDSTFFTTRVAEQQPVSLLEAVEPPFWHNERVNVCGQYRFLCLYADRGPFKGKSASCERAVQCNSAFSSLGCTAILSLFVFLPNRSPWFACIIWPLFLT